MDLRRWREANRRQLVLDRFQSRHWRAEVSIAIYAFPRERIVGDRRARGLTLAECGTAGVHIGGAARPIDWQRREVRLDLIPFRRDVLPEAARAEPSFLGNDLNDSGR